MNRTIRSRIAAETDEIVAARGYRSPSGDVWVDLGPAIDAAQAGTHLHLPADPALHDLIVPGDRAGVVVVTAESTLAATARLTRAGDDLVAALNFASAKHPGGGYRSGAQAQEETIARASALVACLEAVPDYYAFHKAQRDTAYSDRVVCSPSVPVFRGDDGLLLEEPYEATILTAAAPNAGALRDHGRDVDVRPMLVQRGRAVLRAALVHGHRRIVLGAWGCGVFRNDPATVAGAFAELLDEEFARAFDEVTFAILDGLPGTPVLAAFQGALVA